MASITEENWFPDGGNGTDYDKFLSDVHLAANVLFHSFKETEKFSFRKFISRIRRKEPNAVIHNLIDLQTMAEKILVEVKNVGCSVPFERAIVYAMAFLKIERFRIDINEASLANQKSLQLPCYIPVTFRNSIVFQSDRICIAMFVIEKKNQKFNFGVFQSFGTIHYQMKPMRSNVLVSGCIQVENFNDDDYARALIFVEKITQGLLSCIIKARDGKPYDALYSV